MDAGDQLAQGKGLGQVVVGAEGEALHAVVECARGGKHEDAGGFLALRQAAADLVAVHARQVAVEENDLVAVDQRLLQAGFAVEGDVDRHARLAEAAGDDIGQPFVILHDQDAHACIVRVFHLRPR